jgi:membrane protease YdiL (CAAX protease family)
MTTFPATAHPVQPFSIKGFAAQHPILTFFGLLYVIVWLFYLPLILSQDGLGILPYHIPFPPVLINFPASLIGSTGAGFLLAYLLDGRAGMRLLRQRLFKWRIHVLWYAVMLVGIPLAALAGATVTLGATPWTIMAQQGSAFLAAYLPDVLLIGILVSIWEEGGLMGFALPRLQRQFGPLRASVLLGLGWALMHLPAFFVPGVGVGHGIDPWALLEGVVSLTLVAIMVRFLTTWIFNRTAGSILLIAVFHAAMNATQNHLSRMVPGYESLYLLAVFGVAALLLIIATRGRLGYQPES